MCGIGGIVGGSVTDYLAEDISARIAYQLQHRGPDGAAYFADSHAILVHTRLSIIDLKGGTQPIHNEDKSIWITFNGEIFNYIELRAELETAGHQFYTLSDTEVIVHLYEEYGMDFATKLNGQFAIALWDTRTKNLVLCRDRVGISPLFYRHDGDTLFFSSEVKGLLVSMESAPQLNLEAMDQMLTFWSAVSPATIFETIREVKPGQLLVYDLEKNQLGEQSYWDFPFPAKSGDQEIVTEAEAKHTVRELLEDAIRIRLRSDVPVGAYLSGGLDSTILTSVIASKHNNQLKTFSLSFSDSDLDESEHQREVVDYLRTDHQEVLCRNQDIAENFLESILHTEAPVVRTAPVPMGILSGLARSNNYKVVLTGEGADEIFGGYDIFKETKLREFWSHQPESEWRPLLIKRLYPYLDFGQRQSNVFLKSFFGGGVEEPGSPLFSHLPRMTTTSQVKRFYSQETQSALSNTASDRLISSLPQNFGDWRLFSKAQYIESKTLMAGYLLNSQGDRMLMKNSVEGRFPFLDHRLMEFASRIHPKLKMKGFTEKYILKEAMKEYLPESIKNRYKQPYRAPNIPSFFEGEPPAYVSELLSEQQLKNTNYFNPKSVGLLLKKAQKGKAISYRDNMALVFILSTQIWHHLFVDQFHKNFHSDRLNHIIRIA